MDRMIPNSLDDIFGVGADDADAVAYADETILTAAGHFCACEEPVPDAEYSSDCGLCGKSTEVIELSEPGNLYLLHKYVREILGEDRDLWREYGDRLKWENVFKAPVDFDGLWSVVIARGSVSTSEQIITAILPIAEAKLRDAR